jgi:hypothetical protein
LTGLGRGRAVEISGGRVFRRHFGNGGLVAELTLRDGENHGAAQFPDSRLIFRFLRLHHSFERGTHHVYEFRDLAVLHTQRDARIVEYAA